MNELSFATTDKWPGAQMPHNKQLQRTVIRHRARAASAALPLCARGARDTSACRR
jgi:hypothetical protein